MHSLRVPPRAGILAMLAAAMVQSARAGEPRGAETAPGVRFGGRVIDSLSHEPIIGASVSVTELKRGAITRHDGTFAVADLPIGTYTIVVRSIGYQERKISLVLSRDVDLLIALAPTSVTLGQVVVTDKAGAGGLTGSSQSVAVVDPARLEKNRGQTLGESLKDIAGVTLLQTGPSIAKPVIRGLHSQRVVVVNAGVAQEGQQWGAEHAPEIDPFAPSAIEVVRGAAGVEYGAGAIGGVIRVESRPLPKAPGLDGELALNGFSNSMQGSGSLMLEGSSSLLPGFGLRLQGSARQAGDSRAPGYVIGNSGFRELNGSATLGFGDAATSVELLASHFGTKLGIFRGSHISSANDLLRAIELGRPQTDYQFGYEIKAPYQDISHNLLSLHAAHTFANAGRMELQYGYQQNVRKEFDAHNARYLGDTTGAQAALRPALEMTLTTYSLDAKFHHDPIGDLYGTVGLEGIRQGNVIGGQVFLIPQYRSYRGGVYLIENLDKGSWLFNAGARYDAQWMHVYELPSKRIDDRELDFGSLSGAAGAIWHFAPEWSLGANLGTAWRPPGVNELYSDDVHHGTAQYEIGDPSLGVERSYNVDLTLKHQGERSHGELSVYNTRIDDYIYLLPDPTPTVTIRGTYPTFRYKQADALLRGIDASFEYRILDPLSLGATLSLVRGDNRTTGEPLISMPGDRLRLTGHLDLPGVGDWLAEPYLELAGQFVRRQDRYPAGVDYAPPPPGYSLYDVGAGARLTILDQPITLGLSVQNLLNTSYRDYLSRFRYFSDDPGRNIILRLSMPIGAFRP